MLWVVGVHVPLLVAFGLVRGFAVATCALAVVPVSLCFAAGLSPRLPRHARATALAIGLLWASSVLTAFWGGTTEAHFHFFVAVTLLAIYEEWVPYLLAFAFVALEHGVLGAVAPNLVFSHDAGRQQPWLWAGIHAMFILALGAVNLVSWRLNEDARARTAASEERFRTAFEDASLGIALIGLDGRIARANAALGRMLGYEPDDLNRARFPIYCTAVDEVGGHVVYVSPQIEAMIGFSVEEVRGSGAVLADRAPRRPRPCDGARQRRRRGRHPRVPRGRPRRAGRVHPPGRRRGGGRGRKSAARAGLLPGRERPAAARGAAPARAKARVDRTAGRWDRARDQHPSAVHRRQPQLHREGVSELLQMVDTLDGAMLDVEEGSGVRARYEEARSVADVEYLRERIPAAFERTGDGIRRVSHIVKAMKNFARQSNGQHAPVDLNEALQTTLVIAHAEYKLVADVEIDLGEVPSVSGDEGELNQVFVNLIVNAAHAISDVVRETGERGVIGVATRMEGDSVVISISDTGCGISDENVARVFDPFFTTKEVGRGTGQGLALAHTIVCEHHGGAIEIESEVGSGTTFRIRLPVAVAGELPAAA